MQNTNLPHFTTTVQFQDALLAAADAALAADPSAQARILKGYGLVQSDAVTDRQAVRPRWFTVRSASDPAVVYDVMSNGETVCNCPDYEHHATHDNGYLCKHGYAVLLVRKARTLYTPPLRKRHAYHLGLGDEGHARLCPDGRWAMFWPGGRRHGFRCSVDELCLGPHLRLDEQPA